MKPALFLAFALAALTFSARIYRPSHPPPLAHPVAMIAIQAFWGIPVAESHFDADAVSPDGMDRGMWQYRKTYDAERGLVNPFDPLESTRLAAREFRAHFAALGSVELAVTAHHAGLAGARRNGVDWEYIARTRGIECPSKSITSARRASAVYPAARLAKQ